MKTRKDRIPPKSKPFIPVMISGAISLVVWFIFSDPLKGGPPMELLCPLGIFNLIAWIVGLAIESGQRKRERESKYFQFRRGG